MSDEKISAGIQTGKEFVDEGILSGPVEIYHHISAEDQVKGRVEMEGCHEIKSSKRHHVSYRLFDPKISLPFSIPLLKVFSQDVIRYRLYPGLEIYA